MDALAEHLKLGADGPGVFLRRTCPAAQEVLNVLAAGELRQNPGGDAESRRIAQRSVSWDQQRGVYARLAVLPLLEIVPQLGLCALAGAS